MSTENKTSEKLQILKIARIEAMQKRAKIEIEGDFDSKEHAEAESLVTKIAAEIKAENLQIERDIANAKIIESRAAVTKFVTDFEEATAKCVLLHADKKSTLEDKQAASEAMTATKEALLNRLFGGAKTANVSAPTDKVAGERGAKSAAILARAIELFNAGNDGKTVRKIIIEEGHNDGTANAVIKKYEDSLKA